MRESFITEMLHNRSDQMILTVIRFIVMASVLLDGLDCVYMLYHENEPRDRKSVV